ncbi:hypothetical protein P4544_16545 [Halomonas sp. LY9]
MTQQPQAPTTDSVQFDVKDGVAWIGFNRPQSRNAMTWEMYNALEYYCDTLAEDADIHALVLHGVGGGLCRRYRHYPVCAFCRSRGRHWVRATN